MTEEILEEEIIEPEDTRKDASDAELVELSTDIIISDEQLLNGDKDCKPEYYQRLLECLNKWDVQNKIMLYYNGNHFAQIIGENYYYLENDDKSIGSFAGYQFCEEAIKAPEKIVKGYDGNAYFESQCPTPTVEEQNEEIRHKREQAYQETSDHLKQDYDEALARGESDADAKRILWLESKDKVRADNPYVAEEEPLPEPTPKPEVIPSEEPQPEEVFPDNNGIVDNQVIDK